MEAYDGQLAEVYEAVQVDGRSKNYEAEAAELVALVRARAPHAESLLDVACGTGAHLAHLRHRFRRVAGLEPSPAMRRLASARLPEVPVHPGDMRTFRLPDRYDAVTCLFSSIGYVADPAQLKAAVARMAAHLNPGGTLVVEPWLTPEQWRDGHLSHTVAAGTDRTVVRLTHSTRTGRTSRMREHYLVGEPGTGVRQFDDEHVMTLFTVAEYGEALTGAGLHDVEWAGGWAAGRDRLLGTRPG